MENNISKTYHISICDDDKSYIEYVKKLFLEVKQNEETFLFYEYLSGETLLDDLKNRNSCDLLFLDVQLTGMDGNDTAMAFRNKYPNSLLAFCSGVYLPTPESFKAVPFRYFLKSYTQEQMKKELGALCNKMREMKTAPVLSGKRGQQVSRIELFCIEYIDIAKRGSIIHTYENNESLIYFSNQKVSEYFEKLKDFGFAYAHNSYIVNLDFICSITATELELVSGEKLPISRTYSKEFRKNFTDYLAQKY